MVSEVHAQPAASQPSGETPCPAPVATATDAAPVSPRESRYRRALLGTLILCTSVFVLTNWVLWPVKVSGVSMAPNYDDGQPTIINRLAYLSRGPQRGDVVGLRVGNEFYLKRIIALPGERIEFDRETVIVNGQPLAEPYPVKPLLWKLAPMQLGENDYYVMGDNRLVSKLGPVPRDRIIGKAIF